MSIQIGCPLPEEIWVKFNPGEIYPDSEAAAWFELPQKTRDSIRLTFSDASSIVRDEPLVRLRDQPCHEYAMLNCYPTLYFHSWRGLEVVLTDVDGDVLIAGLANNLEPLPPGRISFADVKEGTAVYAFNLREGDQDFEFTFSCRSKHQTVRFVLEKTHEEIAGGYRARRKSK